jgi:superfamily II DNA or RNA helicase
VSALLPIGEAAQRGTIPLRPYQAEGFERVRMRIRTGKRRIVVVMPTGAGKTVLASAIIANALSKGKRAMFVAHRRELIRQTFCKLLRNGIDHNSIGVVMAGTPARSAALFGANPLEVVARMRAAGASDPQIDCELWGLFGARRSQAPIQVASIDTARGKDLGAFDLIIIDECHRALSASYRALVAAYPEAVILGLTATPYRADGKGLGELFDDLVPIATPRQLCEMGFLVEPRIFTVPASALPDLSAVTMSGSDYSTDDLETAVDQSKLVGDIVDHWFRRAENERTVVFAASVKHSRNIVEQFNARAGAKIAEHLDGTTPTGERDAILSRLASGETRVVSNCAVLCEGWDMPIVACCVLARPTKSCGLYLQEAGRILRPCEGKPWALILDHAGCVVEHNGGPLEEREFSLEPPKKKRKSAEKLAIKTCPECFAIIPAAVRTCPECGHVFTAEGREGPEEEAGELVELRDAPREVKLAAWGELCAQRGERRPGWVIARFVERFGVKPPKAWKVPLREDEKPENDSATMATWRELYRAAAERGEGPKAATGRLKARLGFWPNGAMLAEQRAHLDGADLETQLRASVAPEASPASVQGLHPTPAPALDSAAIRDVAAEGAPAWRLPTRLPWFASEAAA